MNVGPVHENSLYDRFSIDLRDQLNVYRRHLQALKTQFADLPSSTQETIRDDPEVLNVVQRQRKRTTTLGRQKRTSSIGVVTKKRLSAAVIASAQDEK